LISVKRLASNTPGRLGADEVEEGEIPANILGQRREIVLDCRHEDHGRNGANKNDSDIGRQQPSHALFGIDTERGGSLEAGPDEIAGQDEKALYADLGARCW